MDERAKGTEKLVRDGTEGIYMECGWVRLRAGYAEVREDG